MHAPAIHDAVRELVERGLTDGAIGRELGLARTTVRDIRTSVGAERERCHRCWAPTRPLHFSAGEYAELLGLYLGDGHVVRAGRTYRLRIALDARHPQIVAEACALLERCFPKNRVSVAGLDGGRTRVVSLYSSHLPCLLPQHGHGKKHRRAVLLEPWQQTLVDAAPWSLIRGLVHSDGCFFINRTGRYRYLSVTFDNLSADIRALFVAACERVGVTCRPSGTSVRIYRRRDVALFAAFVGLKR